jgi:hypothetical protein
MRRDGGPAYRYDRRGGVTMPVNHLVWIKFRPGVAAEQVQDHLKALHALRSEIPDILDLTLGANFTDRANGFTHGLVVTLRDKAALSAYAVHARHVEVAAALRRDGELLVLDYEF